MYKRIILKLSGETLAPEKGAEPSKGATASFDPVRVDRAAETILQLQALGTQVGVVLGGGNIWRGRFTREMDAVSADQMGMLATIINALAVQDAIVRQGGKATVFTAQEMNRFAELYTRDRALEKLESGHIVLLAGGTGNPFFTTDTVSAIRAAELRADAIFKGTTVEGVYDSDPNAPGSKAKLIKDISYQKAIQQGLRVMDLTAFQICMDQSIPQIRVFSMENLTNVLSVAKGEDLGSTVHP